MFKNWDELDEQAAREGNAVRRAFKTAGIIKHAVFCTARGAGTKATTPPSGSNGFTLELAKEYEDAHA